MEVFILMMVMLIEYGCNKVHHKNSNFNCCSYNDGDDVIMMMVVIMKVMVVMIW